MRSALQELELRFHLQNKVGVAVKISDFYKDVFSESVRYGKGSVRAVF